MTTTLTRTELDRLLVEAHIEMIAQYDVDQERRDCWRHAAGLDGNGHGEWRPEAKS